MIEDGLAELHTHLGASVASEIMWSLAHEQGIALPVKDYWEFDRLVTIADPRRVDYVFLPGADNRRLGLVHDHAYWVSGLRAGGGERGAISAVSSAPPPGPDRPGGPFGRAGDPVLERVSAWDGEPPQPESVTAWTCGSSTASSNRAPSVSAPPVRSSAESSGCSQL